MKMYSKHHVQRIIVFLDAEIKSNTKFKFSALNYFIYFALSAKWNFPHKKAFFKL